jgi:hypothetical protein
LRAMSSNSVFTVGAKPVFLPIEPSAPQTLFNSAGDDLYYAKDRDDLDGEGFDPAQLPTLGAGEGTTLDGTTWVRTESARHGATVILLAPDEGENQ